MKKFIVVALVLMAVQAEAATTIVFKGYSSGAAVQSACSYAIGQVSDTDGAFNAAVLGFVNLNTGKSTPAQRVTITPYDYKITCFKKSDGTATPAKISFDNNSTTSYYPTSGMTFRFR